MKDIQNTYKKILASLRKYLYSDLLLLPFRAIPRRIFMPSSQSSPHRAILTLTSHHPWIHTTILSASQAQVSTGTSTDNVQRTVGYLGVEKGTRLAAHSARKCTYLQGTVFSSSVLTPGASFCPSYPRP
jgi:hypothetical protein